MGNNLSLSYTTATFQFEFYLDVKLKRKLCPTEISIAGEFVLFQLPQEMITTGLSTLKRQRVRSKFRQYFGHVALLNNKSRVF